MSSRFRTQDMFQRVAKEVLDSATWNYLQEGAGSEYTIHANRAAFDLWEFRPRQLGWSSPADGSTSVLGIELPFPLIGAPFGMDRLFHPDGFEAVARAHDRMKVPFVLSRASSISLERIGEIAPDCPRMFQMLPVGPPELGVQLATRAREAGYCAIVVTVDAAVPGWRDKSRQGRLIPPGDDHWGNFRDGRGRLDRNRFQELEISRLPVWDWTTIGRLFDEVGLPWIAKGVLTAHEAMLALSSGASAIYVSNHGGRQLDGAPAALSQLPEVADGVGGRVPVILDGGIRRGTDVVKAIALGADAVGWGRPTALALASGGEEGVYRSLELLQEELETAMTLLGRRKISEIGRDVLQPSRLGPGWFGPVD